MKKISVAQLKELLCNGKKVNGGTFVGIDTITVPSLKGGKQNPHKDIVTKTTIGSSVMVFQNKNSNAYQNMIVRRLEEEGKDTNFELSPRKWGQRVEGTPLVEHKGNYYIEVIFLKAGKTTYQLEGKDVDKSEIIGLDLNKEEGKQGGLDNKVIIRTYKLSSITRITIGKETYLIED